jgi:(E)-4-hydroxy-3-methylbut-2-enyl-diphosphate synthase
LGNALATQGRGPARGVNGPGEARELDIGVAAGNGKGQIFVRGQVIRTVPESQIVEALLAEAARIAEEMGVDVEA